MFLRTYAFDAFKIALLIFHPTFFKPVRTLSASNPTSTENVQRTMNELELNSVQSIVMTSKLSAIINPFQQAIGETLNCHLKTHSSQSTSV